MVLVTLKHTIIIINIIIITFLLVVLLFRINVFTNIYSHAFSFQLLTVDVKLNVIQFKCVITIILFPNYIKLPLPLHYKCFATVITTFSGSFAVFFFWFFFTCVQHMLHRILKKKG